MYHRELEAFQRTQNNAAGMIVLLQPPLDNDQLHKGDFAS